MFGVGQKKISGPVKVQVCAAADEPYPLDDEASAVAIHGDRITAAAFGLDGEIAQRDVARIHHSEPGRSGGETNLSFRSLAGDHQAGPRD
jgi:hypothetical protein